MNPTPTTPAPVVVCAWCPTFVPTPGQITHGICPACIVRFETPRTEGTK